MTTALRDFATETETHRQALRAVATLVSLRHPEWRADVIWAVLLADPTLDADGVAAVLVEAEEEHAAER
jgi:hypothetical protein